LRAANVDARAEPRMIFAGEHKVRPYETGDIALIACTSRALTP
jgi:hypothetical protein